MIQPRLVGIVHFWIRNVQITGPCHNEYMPPGTVGDLEVLEMSLDGRVINARFHPGGEGNGYGLVVWPHWDYASNPGHHERMYGHLYTNESRGGGK